MNGHSRLQAGDSKQDGENGGRTADEWQTRRGNRGAAGPATACAPDGAGADHATPPDFQGSRAGLT
ncbi:hypothetical protein CRM94_34310 [Burkholderia gladioli]|uniref:Uncharacterized protein n=1 Tax=Burkholderia gladioli TaxID=28095 RepID=A0A2A7S739_BURGA|nr:hypothetical protein CRM94_34310 [Burkholderia gladioli]